MPLYEYECVRCGYRFEKMLSVARRDEAVCEKCGGEVQRVYRGKCVFGLAATAKSEPCGNCCGGECPGCCGFDG